MLEPEKTGISSLGKRGWRVELGVGRRGGCVEEIGDFSNRASSSVISESTDC